MACFCTGACRTTGRCGAAEGLTYGRAESMTWPDQPLGMDPKIIQDMVDRLTQPESQPVKEDEAPGFHPIEGYRPPCMDAGHGFPTHLYIPSGMKYVHYCPSCGQKTVAYGTQVWC